MSAPRWGQARAGNLSPASETWPPCAAPLASRVLAHATRRARGERISEGTCRCNERLPARASKYNRAARQRSGPLGITSCAFASESLDTQEPKRKASARSWLRCVSGVAPQYSFLSSCARRRHSMRSSFLMSRARVGVEALAPRHAGPIAGTCDAASPERLAGNALALCTRHDGRERGDKKRLADHAIRSDYVLNIAQLQ